MVKVVSPDFTCFAMMWKYKIKETLKCESRNVNLKFDILQMLW